MKKKLHPDEILFPDENLFPSIPCCEHIAGKEKYILKSFGLQEEKGPVFDITLDCEDGAPVGGEAEHAKMVAKLINSDHNKYKMAGVRIHDHTSPYWKNDVETILGECGDRLAYLTIPKVKDAQGLEKTIDYIRAVAERSGIKQVIPLHVFIETNRALREIENIARLPWLQVLDFGLIDFIAAHNGVIPGSALHSPGQFEHELIRRAKGQIVATALAHGLVPSHNVTLDLKNYKQTFADARRARFEFGFLRMWSIYPLQIDAIIEAMQPDHSEIEKCVVVLIKAQENEWGALEYNGELQDRATYRSYWGLLKRAKANGIKLPAEAEKRWFT